MRNLLIVLFLLAAPPIYAQGFDAGAADFRLGSLDGGDPTDSVRATSEMFWDLNLFDVQAGGSISQISGESSEGDVRVIVSRSTDAPIRFGLSASLVSNDSVGTNVAVFGLHILHDTPSQYFEGEFLIPDHINSTGMFSFDVDAEQWLTRDLSITTHLYRRSTDPEAQDMYSIGVGANYRLNDNITLTGEAFQTRADDYDFNNNGGRIGVSYQASSALELTAAVMHVVPEFGELSSGVTITADIDFGGSDGTGRLFRSRPLPDRFALAAFCDACRPR